MSRALAVLAALLLFGLPARAQDAPPYRDALLDRLVGRWVLRGTIAEGQTTHDVTADWVLGHQYVRLHEVSREKDATGRPAYEAIVFIGQDPAGSGYACLWLDSTGGTGLNGRALGHAPPGTDTLAFVFEMPDGSRFHTTFAHAKAGDTWRWRMDAETGGGLQPFARVTLTRKRT